MDGPRSPPERARRAPPITPLSDKVEAAYRRGDMREKRRAPAIQLYLDLAMHHAGLAKDAPELCDRNHHHVLFEHLTDEAQTKVRRHRCQGMVAVAREFASWLVLYLLIGMLLLPILRRRFSGQAWLLVGAMDAGDLRLRRR